MLEINYLGNRQIEIRGAEVESAAERIATEIGGAAFVGDSGTIRGRWSKNDTQQIERIIGQINAASTPAPAPRGERYIERLEVAERNGLNHGRSWVCNGWQVDQHSLPPEFEGELVCYVYPEGK